MKNLARTYIDQGHQNTKAEQLEVQFMDISKKQLEVQAMDISKKRLEVQVMESSKKLLAIPTSIYGSNPGPETPCNPGHGGTFIHTSDCASPTSEGQ